MNGGSLYLQLKYIKYICEGIIIIKKKQQQQNVEKTCLTRTICIICCATTKYTVDSDRKNPVAAK